MGQADLPLASGEKHARALERAGLVILPRRGRGKHFLLQRPGERPIISIPDHREVKRSLLAKQLKLARISESEYATYFR